MGSLLHLCLQHCLLNSHHPPSHPTFNSLFSLNRTCYFVVVQLLSHVQLFAIPWTTTCRGSLSITNSWSLLKFMSVESVMPSNHLIFCHPLLLLPSIFHSIRVFSNELVFASGGQSIGVSDKINKENALIGDLCHIKY